MVRPYKMQKLWENFLILIQIFDIIFLFMKKLFLPIINILISITLSLYILSYAYADDVFPPIIIISGVSEGQYYSTAVYSSVSVSDVNLAYYTVTIIQLIQLMSAEQRLKMTGNTAFLLQLLIQRGTQVMNR